MSPAMRRGSSPTLTLRTVVLATTLVLVPASCGGGSPRATEGSPGPELVAQVASYDLYAGPELRVIVGLLT